MLTLISQNATHPLLKEKIACEIHVWIEDQVVFAK